MCISKLNFTNTKSIDETRNICDINLKGRRETKYLNFWQIALNNKTIMKFSIDTGKLIG